MGTKENSATGAQAILDAGDSVGSAHGCPYLHLKVDVQENHAKTEAHASVKTSVNVHFFILVLSVQEKDWEPKTTLHQTHRQFLTPAIV